MNSIFSETSFLCRHSISLPVLPVLSFRLTAAHVHFQINSTYKWLIPKNDNPCFANCGAMDGGGGGKTKK